MGPSPHGTPPRDATTPPRGLTRLRRTQFVRNGSWRWRLVFDSSSASPLQLEAGNGTPADDGIAAFHSIPHAVWCARRLASPLLSSYVCAP